ncbi:autotransporter domain-containing protein [Pseudomonas sp. FW306-02-F02-AA]|uniref:Transporter n=1 Tax=Pseudomonas fluorescens TaxID=294 RepID=A0A0N7H045_PSEFL|nr:MULTISPECIES: autotransporter outer membrane beta-barrel domain-containing protein [Pseudomonas]ALI02116.1 transporter [Pseudomonas fluorescens]PMZ01050.1 autotransporter domain-containing protein [Pseudomonas sp. FW306-02-F02-AB]PMZ06446.1 autotransporter domain-containing protein [Pseudomonas sp. FW306-02-H06C]PMZ13817.1 autotransporter domain-containing protein [Pseudomonas sp. FW306-02-F02-AA]PMZ19208.1 autotransporter domain-containing protein [Pseudomonas sp. FW306-02-F08-AA]
MNTSCLRRSLLALSVAAAAIHTPAIAAPLNLINDGSIKVYGDGAFGIKDQGSVVTNNVLNSGDIAVSGMNATGMALIGTRIGNSVINQGTITATGANAEALRLDGATFAPTPGVRSFSIYNTGLISGENLGIHVSNQPASGRFMSIDQQYGSIEGGNAAIQVDDGEAYFYWNGGNVKGNLMGLSGVKINGDVNFDGSTIKAGYITVEKGELTLQQAHTTIIGEFDMEEPSSVLHMFLGNDTNPNLPVLKVTGLADIGPGARLELKARSEDFRTANGGTRYTLISSGKLEGGENLTVSSSSALLEVKSYGVEGNDVKALVDAKGEAVVGQNVLNAGGSSNAASAAARVSNGLMTKLDEHDPVFQAFANASSDAELAKLAEKLTPDVSGGATQAAVSGQSLINSVINTRSSSARSGLSSGDVLAEKGVWLQALNSDADQGSRGGVAGYSANSQGIAVGADGQLNADTTLGIAYSYLNSNVTSDAGSKTDVIGNALTLYGNWTHDNFFVDTSLTYGWNTNESKRYIAGTRAKGDYDSDIFGVNALAGYTLRFNQQVVLEPQVGARYANVAIDTYREKGSSAALSVGSQRYEVGEMGLGARLAAAFDVGAGSLQPEAKAMAWHDFIGDQANATSTFVLGGTPFTTSGAKPARDSYELGLGATYRIGAWSVGGSYDYLTKADFNADTFTAKVRYDF